MLLPSKLYLTLRLNFNFRSFNQYLKARIALIKKHPVE